MIAPCMDCPNKGCGAYHNECPEYLSWKNELDTKNEKIRNQKETRSMLDQIAMGKERLKKVGQR